MNEHVCVELVSLEKLFCKERQLSIPSYQRGYCWDKEQVESLLESLWAANHDMKYHLGTIILHCHKNQNNIVDGQQRLLTLSILIHCLNKENHLNKDEYKKIAEDNPLLNSKTNDLDVIKHVFNNSEVISNWIACHPPSQEGILDNLVFTVVTISQKDSTDTEADSDEDKDSPQTDPSLKDGYDSSLPLAWTFFNAINSGGKLLSDYDLLKAHHLRYLSSAKSNDLLIQYKAAKWDSNGEQKVESFYGEKLNLYEVSFAHTFYLIRSWLKNRSITVSQLPADSRYCILHHYSALLSITHADGGGGMTGLTSGVIGGKHFFDWTEYWMWQFREFCDNPVVKCFNAIPWAGPQRHLRIIARALLFYYFSKFGDLYLADACIFILYRIGRLRNTSAKKRNAWYGNDSKGDQCAPHTIAAIEESPSPEYFFQYCQMPSNRYVRHYDLKEGTIKREELEILLKSLRLGPDWWKRLLAFAASAVKKQQAPPPNEKQANSDRIPICLDVPHIGGSICYKKEIAVLLNDVAKDFGWKYDPQTLELNYNT